MNPDSASDDQLTSVEFVQGSWVARQGLGWAGALLILRSGVVWSSHPDYMFLVLGCLSSVLAMLLIAFPQRLILTADSLQIFSFGRKVLDIPWEGIASLTIFRPQRLPSNGIVRVNEFITSRALGIALRPDQRARSKYANSERWRHGYDVVIWSMWDQPIAKIVSEAARRWSGRGGDGDVKDLCSKF